MGSLRAEAIVKGGWVPWPLLPSSSSSSSAAGSPSSSSPLSSYEGKEDPRFRFFLDCVLSPSEEEEVEAESDESDSDSEESV